MVGAKLEHRDGDGRLAGAHRAAHERAVALRGAVWLFTAISVGAAVLHLEFGYLLLGPGDLTVEGRSFLAVALATQGALLALVASLPALALTLVRRVARTAVVVAPLGAWILHVYLAADRLVFMILGTHIGRAVLKVALTPGGIDSLDVQRGEWLRVAAFLAALAGGVTVAMLAALALARQGASRTVLRVLGVSVVSLFTADRLVYAIAPLTGWREPIRAASLLPLHGLETSLSIRLAPERFRYPRVALRFHSVSSPPSVLWIVVESWRSDALNPENMPAVWRWSRGATRFLDHRSGGNWTYAGVMSQFYGLHAAYAGAAEDAKRGPVIFDRAMALGMDVKVIASRGTRFPGFRTSVFAGLPSGVVEDDLPGRDSAEKDRVLVDRAVRFLRGRNPGQPFFLAIFLDATHLPYAFGRESIRYRPFSEHLYYTEMTTPLPREPIYNRYRNAVADVDASIGKVLDALATSGAESRTLVVLTGDHGQEFYEHGALGHNIALNGPQTAVPLVLKLPGLAPGDVHGRTRGVDIVPTLMERFGVENPPEDYCLGRPLPAGAGPGRTVMCGMIDCALLEDDGTTTVFRPGDPLEPHRVFDRDWHSAPGAAASGSLPEVRREFRAFLE